MAKERLPAFMPDGDYPQTVQPDRVEREPMGTAAAKDVVEGREPERELTREEQEREPPRWHCRREGYRFPYTCPSRYPRHCHLLRTLAGVDVEAYRVACCVVCCVVLCGGLLLSSCVTVFALCVLTSKWVRKDCMCRLLFALALGK